MRINPSAITYSIFVILMLGAAMTGCQSKVLNPPEGVPALIDDGYIPDSPKWNSVTPVDVEKVGDKQYQVVLDWEPVTTNNEDNSKKNIIGYNVYRRKESAIDKKIATLGTDQHYFVDKSPELAEGEKFIYTVSAFDNMLRESTHNDVQIVRMEPERRTIPKSPSNIFFAPGNQILFGRDRGEIILSWDPPVENVDNSPADNLSEYEIESHKNDDSTWRLIARIPAGKNIFVDSNLMQGTYFYRIRVKNSAGNYSQYVDGNCSIFGKMDEMAPGTITNLEVWYQKGRNYLTWQNPKTDADGKTLDMLGVKIYRKPRNSNEPFALVKIMPPDTRYTDYNIDIDKYYVYALTAFDASGNESVMSRPITSEPKATYLDTPKNLYAKLSKDSTLTINWDAVEGAKKYFVYRSPMLESGIYTKSGETATNTIVMSIPYGNTYYFKITAVDENGIESSLSSALQVVSDVLYKSVEAEEYLGDISKGVNAASRDFDLDVNVIDYADSEQRDAYLRFSPIAYSAGEKITGMPISNKDSNAVDEFIEIPVFMTPNSYKCEIWVKKGPDCGVYKIEANGKEFGPIDCYSVNNREIMKFPINFAVEDDVVNRGKIVRFRFTCQSKNQDSKDYILNLDRIVLFR